MATSMEYRCNSSVDVDPDWYAGQPETADVDASQATADEPASHVPSVLQKLLKWGNYDGYGEPVWPSRFIPMKTPLSEQILDSWELPEPPKHRLTVPDLLAAQTAAGRHVGLLLDLSNHDCLYVGDIPSNVQYLHVQLVAKELPPLEFVREVGRAANHFWEHHPNDFIAIHCAYGFNRTGFVVCSYLIEHCGLSVEQALASFARSRPPGVKHERFRNELHARYGSINHNLPRPITCIHAAAVYAQCNCSGGSIAECIQQGALLPPFLQPHLLVTATGANADAQYSSCSQCSSTTMVRGDCGACSCNFFASIDQSQQQAAGASPNSSSSCHQLPPIPGNSGASGTAAGDGYCQLGGRPMKRVGSNTGSVRGNFNASVLSSSPLPRLPPRCQSSCSVGDNSSIGCSPPDCGADLLLTGGSNYSPASSSVLSSVQGYRVPVGLMGCSPEQQQPAAAGPGSKHRGSNLHISNAPHGTATDIDGASDGANPARQDDADADCFEMDPCGEQPDNGAGSGWCDGSKPCCEQQQQQQHHAAELTGLMRAVNLGQQQQPQHQQPAEQSPLYSDQHGGRSDLQEGDMLQQQPLSEVATCCHCSCHMVEGTETSSGGGADPAEQQGRQRSRLRYSQLSSEGSGFGGSLGLDLIENESFGKITSADLLKNLRGLRSAYDEK